MFCSLVFCHEVVSTLNHNPRVGGSSPSSATIIFNHLGRAREAARLSTGASPPPHAIVKMACLQFAAFRRSAHLRDFAPVGQAVVMIRRDLLLIHDIEGGFDDVEISDGIVGVAEFTWKRP